MKAREKKINKRQMLQAACICMTVWQSLLNVWKDFLISLLGIMQ